MRTYEDAKRVLSLALVPVNAVPDGTVFESLADLALVVCIINNHSIICITDAWLKDYGATREQVFKDARENTEWEITWEELDHVLDDMNAGRPVNYGCGYIDKAKAYCVTNKNNFYGASVLGTERFKRLFDGFYIIPTSVNEITLMPISDCVDVRKLNQLVLDSNSKLRKNMVLSNRIYQIKDGRISFPDIPSELMPSDFFEHIKENYPYGTQDDKMGDAVVLAHYYLPGTACHWFATEFDDYDGDDVILFGYADLGIGFPEYGSFSINELKNMSINGFSVLRESGNGKTLAEFCEKYGVDYPFNKAETA